MQPCCQDFAAHEAGSVRDGFRVVSSLWMLPYTVKMARLLCEIPEPPARSVAIRFCPWCGRDLGVTADTFLGPLDK